MNDDTTTIDVDGIAEDPTLLPQEKETIIRWAKDQDRVHVYTAIRGVARRLVQHPHFELESKEVNEGDVTAVRGTLPLGVLSIRSNPRSHGSHADVVTEEVLRDS